jgi:hypothetical protein
MSRVLLLASSCCNVWPHRDCMDCGSCGHDTAVLASMGTLVLNCMPYHLDTIRNTVCSCSQLECST